MALGDREYESAGPSLASGGFSGGGTVAQQQDPNKLSVNYGGSTPWNLYSKYGNATPWGEAKFTPTEQGWRPLFNAPGQQGIYQNYYQQPNGQQGEQPLTTGEAPWWQGAMQYRDARVGDQTRLGTVVGEDNQNYQVEGPQGQQDYYEKYYFQKQAQAPDVIQPTQAGQPQKLGDLFPQGTVSAGGPGFNEQTGLYDQLPQGWSMDAGASLNTDTSQPNRVILGPDGQRYILNTQNGQISQDAVAQTQNTTLEQTRFRGFPWIVVLSRWQTGNI